MDFPGRFFAAGLLAIGLTNSTPAAAQDCPTAKTAGAGYVVERGGNARSEVFRDGSIVRTIYRIGGNVLLETTQFEGLFDLDRLDRGRRSTSKPKKDLAKLFPLKNKQHVFAEFDIDAAGAPATKRTIELRVTGAEDIYIGKCKYGVLKIERSQSQGASPPVFFNVDYYAPELKLIVAKEFRESGGRTTMTKFDKIYTIAK
jgi:hypothetical protein